MITKIARRHWSKLCTVTLLLILHSCGSRQGTEGLQELIGREIVLSAGMSSRIMDRDTVIDLYDTLSYTILIYYNAEGCTPCKLKQLFEWDLLMRDINRKNVDCRFLYILNTQTTTWHEIETTLMGCQFEHPVLLDTAGIFERSNPGLPSHQQFHTFLLDRNNRVVLVGSPIGNPKMWELYKSTIARLVANGGTLTDRETSITRK